MRNRVTVIDVPERLDRIKQALLREGFETIRIGQRQADPSNCFVLGKHATLDPSVVEQAVRQAALSTGILLEKVKAGRAREWAPWQVDFTAVNLLEANDDFDMSRLINTAVEFTPRYGDEFRMQRLAKWLKSHGWQFDYIEMQVTCNASRGSFPNPNEPDKRRPIVSYYISKLHDPTGQNYIMPRSEIPRSEEMSEKGAQVYAAQKALSLFTIEEVNAGHAHESAKLSISSIMVDYNHASRMMSAWFYQPSYYVTGEDMPSIEVVKSLDSSSVRESEEEDDLNALAGAAVNATPGARTRIFADRLTEKLTAIGLPLMGRVHFKSAPWAGKATEISVLMIAFHSYTRDGQALLSKKVGEVVVDAIRSLGIEPKQYPGRAAPFDVMQHNQVMLYMQFTIPAFEDLSFLGSLGSHTGIFGESDGIEADFNFGERERLYRLMAWVDKNVFPLLWAYVEPLTTQLNRAPGTVHYRFRVMTQGISLTTEQMYRLARMIYVHTETEPLNDPGNPMKPDLHVWPVNSKVWDIGMFLAPVGPPPPRRVYLEGPSLERYRDVEGAEPPDGIVEELDPETEYYIRKSVEKTPGFLDKQRLSDALKLLAENGVQVEWAMQFKWPWDLQHQDLSKTSSKVGVQMAIISMDSGKAFRLAKLTDDVMSVYFTLTDEVKVDYHDVVSNRLLVTFGWMSHDAPENITSFTLRAPDWSYDSMVLCRQAEERMLLESDPPMEQDPDMGDIFSQAMGKADPGWEDRIFLDNLAVALTKEGFSGKVVQSASNIEQPFVKLFLWARLGRNPHEIKTALARALVSCGIGAVEDIQRLVFTHTEMSQPASDAVSVHLKFAHKPSGNIDQRIEVRFYENAKRWIGAKEMLTEMAADLGQEPSPDDKDMLRQLTRQALNTPEDVLIKAVEHLRQKLKEFGKHGWITLAAYPDRSMTKVEVMVRINTDAEFSWPQWLRDEILRGGLKRYYPRRVLYFKWPKVMTANSTVGDDGTRWMDFIISFHMRKFVDNLHKHWPDIQEAQEDIDPAEFMLQANRGTVWDNRTRIMSLAKMLNDRGYGGYLGFFEPSTVEGGACRVQGRVVWMDQNRKPKLNETVREDILDGLKSMPDYAANADWINKIGIMVSFQEFPIDNNWSKYPYHWSIDFYMPVGPWKEMGDIMIDLPGPVFTVDVKI